MKRAIIIVSLLLVVAVTILVVAINSFQLFDAHTVYESHSRCDHDGVRSYNAEILSGDATTNPSLHISIEPCGSIDIAFDSVFFVADKPNLSAEDFDINWVNFDSLEVIYSQDLRVFRQDSTIKIIRNGELDVSIIYSYLDKPD